MIFSTRRALKRRVEDYDFSEIIKSILVMGLVYIFLVLGFCL